MSKCPAGPSKDRKTFIKKSDDVTTDNKQQKMSENE